MPKDSLPREEFMERLSGFDEVERRVVEERLRTNYRRERMEFLTEDEAGLLGAMLDRLIPQEGSEKVDLVSFMDWAIPNPLGYGDRQEGMPDGATLIREGLKGVDQAAGSAFAGRLFLDLSDAEKDQVLMSIQQGSAEGEMWKSIPCKEFFRRLMQKAVAGYCAHPNTWMRIGFYGPAYPEGYVWVSGHEVRARHGKKAGHLRF